MGLRTTSGGTPVNVDLLVWDIMGHRGFRELLKESYFEGTRGILAVADMTRRSTLKDLDAWITDVQSVSGRVPVVIIGANHDKKNRLEVSEEEVTRVAKAHDAPCFFASETSGEEVEAAFRNLADAVVRSMSGSPPNWVR